MSERKHDHKHTSKLKVCLFATAMTMPLITLTPTLIYYGFNEHAVNTDTYNIEYEGTTNEVNSWNDLQKNNFYTFNTNNKIYDYFSTDIKLGFYVYNGQFKLNSELDDWTIDEVATSTDTIIDFEKLYIRFNYYDNDGIVEIFFDIPNSNDAYSSTMWSFNNLYAFDFINTTIKLTYYEIQNNDYIPNMFSKCENIPIKNLEIQEGNITNSINKALNDTWNMDIYRWVENTPYKNGINGMLQTFGITNNSYIANLLTYWISITLIYVIIDIIIETFVYISHLISNRKQD